MLTASIGAADAQVQAGVLECRGGGGVGFILGSVTNLGCALHVDGVPDDLYVAAIQNLGVDIGATEVALAWVVSAAAAQPALGGLAGPYVRIGGVADGSVLSGGPNGSIALQPVKGQSEASRGIAASLEGLLLRPRE